jgi:hypothetical protein
VSEREIVNAFLFGFISLPLALSLSRADDAKKNTERQQIAKNESK